MNTTFVVPETLSGATVIGLVRALSALGYAVDADPAVMIRVSSPEAEALIDGLLRGSVLTAGVYKITPPEEPVARPYDLYSPADDLVVEAALATSEPVASEPAEPGGLADLIRLVNETTAPEPESLPADPVTEAQPPARPQRACTACGELFVPRRKDTQYCSKPECQAEKDRSYSRSYWSRRNGTPGTPRKGPLVPDKQDGPVVYEVLDGKYAGERMTSEQLASALWAWRLPVDTRVRHERKGMYKITQAVSKNGKHFLRLARTSA